MRGTALDARGILSHYPRSSAGPGGVISDRGVVLWVAQAVSACVGWWWCEDVRWCVGARESWALALAATLVVGGC